MEKEEYSNLKAKFLSLVASVPLPLRGEIIAVIEKQTVSWDAASAEVKYDGPKAEAILEQLKKIGLL